MVLWFCIFFGWLMLVLLMIEKIFYVVVWWWFFDGLEDCVLEQCGKGEDRIKPSHWKCCFFCLPDGIATIHQDLMLLLKFSSHFNKYRVQISGARFAWKHLIHFLPTHVNLVPLWEIWKSADSNFPPNSDCRWDLTFLTPKNSQFPDCISKDQFVLRLFRMQMG